MLFSIKIVKRLTIYWCRNWYATSRTGIHMTQQIWNSLEHVRPDLVAILNDWVMTWSRGYKQFAISMNSHSLIRTRILTSDQTSMGLEVEIIVHWTYNLLVNHHPRGAVSAPVAIVAIPWKETDMMVLPNNDEGQFRRAPGQLLIFPKGNKRS